MTDIVRSADGTVIAFDRSGAGPALIIVGGALSERSAAAGIAAQLAPSFTVFAFDRRGRGDSGDTQPYALEREIEDIAALIELAGGSSFVFGHSSGAVLSLRATAAGLAIPRLALYEPPFFVDNSRPLEPPDYIEHLDELLAAGRREDAVEYFMTASVGVPPQVVDGMRRDPSWSGLVALAHTIPYDRQVLADTLSGSPAPLRQWASVSTPTLIIDGGASFPFLHASADAIAAVLPHAERRTLPGQGHGAAPDVLAPVLVEFFLR
jgi:pimeloyl-ACP methyl ester carboxylesterase